MGAPVPVLALEPGTTEGARPPTSGDTPGVGGAARGRAAIQDGGGPQRATRQLGAAPPSEPDKPKKAVVFEDKATDGLDAETIRDLRRRASEAKARREGSRERAKPAAPATGTTAVPKSVVPQPPMEGLGTMLQLMDAKGSQGEVVRLLQTATSTVHMLGYTYDEPSIQDAMIVAAMKRVVVKIGLDHRTTLSTRPRDQCQFAQQLQANNIEVFLMKGGPLGPEYKRVGRPITGTGIQHAKTVLADDHLVIGSCNWTVSSRANSELGALIRMTPRGAQLLRDTIEARMAGGERLAVALSRPRGRSVSRSAVETDDSK